jgi:hypothetical protein
VTDICYSSRLDGVFVRLYVLVHVCIILFVGRFFFFSWEGNSRPNFQFSFFHRTRVAGIMLSRYNNYARGCTLKISWLDSWQGKDIYLLSKISRPAPVKWVSGVPFNGIKRLGSAAHRSSSSNTEIKNEWSYTSYLPYVFMVCTETGSPS